MKLIFCWKFFNCQTVLTNSCTLRLLLNITYVIKETYHMSRWDGKTILQNTVF